MLYQGVWSGRDRGNAKGEVAQTETSQSARRVVLEGQSPSDSVVPWKAQRSSPLTHSRHERDTHDASPAVRESATLSGDVDYGDSGDADWLAAGMAISERARFSDPAGPWLGSSPGCASASQAPQHIGGRQPFGQPLGVNVVTAAGGRANLSPRRKIARGGLDFLNS